MPLPGPASVLLTTDAVGGIWTYAIDLGRELAGRGVRVTLAVLGPAAGIQAREAAEGAGLALVDTGLQPEWLAADEAEVLRAGEDLAALARAQGVDLVHLNHPALGAAAPFDEPVLAACHSCVASWWEAVRGTSLPDDLRWRMDLVARGYRAARATIAPTLAFARTTQRLYGLPACPAVVHNGRAPSKAADQGMEDGVLTAGRLWDEGKNIAALDRAAGRLALPVRAAGSTRGPNGAVVVLDSIEGLGILGEADMRLRLARRPIYAAPALYEPFGLAVLEAAQAGCALVLGDIPTFRELWDGAALFVPPRDDAALAAAIAQLSADPASRERLGAAARRRAARYDLAAFVDGIEALYGQLLAGRREDARRVRIVYFTHSLRSCWNHGNAHFLRGVLSELIRRGHDVAAFEPEGAWSLDNLLRDAGEAGLSTYRAAYPGLIAREYAAGTDAAALCAGADVVLVHEWNDPALVAAVGGLRRRGAPFTLLFHDTHHRAVSDPPAMRAFDLDGYDGVLAFGETLAAVYRDWGWGSRVFVWHEAADTHVFHPPAEETARQGLVWIGNWGDDERSAELEAYLFRPARTAGLPLTIHGVRYPPEALRTLDRYGVAYRGWLPNAAAPAAFAQALATVHVPRRFYVDALPGIPTIRVFEALACGIPLLSAPWRDSEGLFEVGQDFLMADDEAAMTKNLRAVRDDADLRAALVAHGLHTIRTRHSCAHRVDELMGVLAALGAPVPAEPVP